jgi:hypothetical protein
VAVAFDSTLVLTSHIDSFALSFHHHPYMASPSPSSLSTGSYVAPSSLPDTLASSLQSNDASTRLSGLIPWFVNLFVLEKSNDKHAHSHRRYKIDATEVEVDIDVMLDSDLIFDIHLKWLSEGDPANLILKTVIPSGERSGSWARITGSLGNHMTATTIGPEQFVSQNPDGTFSGKVRGGDGTHEHYLALGCIQAERKVENRHSPTETDTECQLFDVMRFHGRLGWQRIDPPASRDLATVCKMYRRVSELCCI